MEEALDKLLGELDSLAVNIGSLHENQKAKIVPLLNDTLEGIKKSGGIDEKQFINPLIALSRELIKSCEHHEFDFIEKIGLPSYDLFLPFKAREVDDSDKQGSNSGVGDVINYRVDAIFENLEKNKLSNPKKSD